MIPRLSTSKTWTQFPPEFLEQIQEIVSETFEDNLIDGASLHLEGRIYQEEILFRLGIKMPGQLRQSNFEASAQYDPIEQNAKKTMHRCIEAAAAMMAEYFEFYYNEPSEEDSDDENEFDALENGIDFPREWTEFKFEGTPVFLQYSTLNTDLESEADRILGEHPDSLVNEKETDNTEDALNFVVEERIKTSDEETDDDIHWH